MLLTASAYLVLIAVALVGRFIGSFVIVLSMGRFGRLARTVGFRERQLRGPQIRLEIYVGPITRIPGFQKLTAGSMAASDA